MTGKTNVIKEVTKEIIKEVGIPTTKGTSVVYHRSSTSTIEGSGDNTAIVFFCCFWQKNNWYCHTFLWHRTALDRCRK